METSKDDIQNESTSNRASAGSEMLLAYPLAARVPNEQYSGNSKNPGNDLHLEETATRAWLGDDLVMHDKALLSDGYADDVGNKDGDEDMVGENDEDVDQTNADDDELIVQNPSQDIRGDLQAALNIAPEFSGDFSYKKSHADAPNPALQIDGLGLIGLPLSEREAKVIISHCKMTPFGESDQMNVDSPENGTWEMDPSKIRFGNPAWKAFMDRALKDVCQTLGVNFDVTKPRAELSKLVLYEKGVFSLPHQGTGKPDEVFATLMVVLPSPFTGGATHLSSEDFSTRLDYSPSSNFQTSISAWFTVLRHEIKPITSGYQLVLFFDLTRPSTSPRPSLPTSHIIVNKLRRTLLSWKQRADAKPSKLVILLEHNTYSREKVRFSDLKGSDARKASLLNLLAVELGFRVYMATLEFYQSGDPKSDDEDDEDYGGYGPDSDAEVEMGDVYEEEMRIKNIIDRQGKLVMKSLPGEDDSEMIPSTLYEDMRAADADDQKFSGGRTGTVEQWYRRNVLLIWPNLHVNEIEGPKAVLRILSEVKRPKPTKDEQEMIKSTFTAVNNSQIPKKTAALVLCRLAISWNDFSLWERTISNFEAWNSVNILGVEGILYAVARFGFEQVRPTIEELLKREKSNMERYKVLTILQRLMLKKNDRKIVPWLAQQQKLIAKSLKTPSLSEIPLLLSLTSHFGGLPFLASDIVPQLKEIADPSFLLAFARHVHSQAAEMIRNDDDRSIFDRVITELLASSNSKVDFFAVVAGPPNQNKAHDLPTWPLITSNLGFAHLEACILTGNSTLIPDIVEKLTSMHDATAENIQSRAKLVLLPLILELSQMRLNILPTQVPFPDMTILCQTAIALYMDQFGTFLPSDEEWDGILAAVTLGGGADFLEKTMLSKAETLPELYQVPRKLIDQLQVHRADLVEAGVSHVVLTAIISALVERYIQHVDLSYNPPKMSKWMGRMIGQHDPAGRLQDRIADTLELCFNTDNAELSPKLLTRLTNTTMTQEGIIKALIPLLNKLAMFCQHRNISIDSEPFASTCKWIVKSWASDVLDSPPLDYSNLVASIKANLCQCSTCDKVIKFLTESWEQYVLLEGMGSSTCEHIQSKLETFAKGVVTLKTYRFEARLELDKTPEFIAWRQWKREESRGISILQTISPDNQIVQNILGNDYQAIHDLITGKRLPKASDPLVPTQLDNAAGSSRTLETGPAAFTFKEGARPHSTSQHLVRKRRRGNGRK